MTIEVDIPIKAEKLIGLLIQADSAFEGSGKEALKQSLEWYFGKGGFNLMLGSHPFLTVDLKECGGSAVYETWEDVPEVDVPCPCSNPNHWLIKYEMPRV